MKTNALTEVDGRFAGLLGQQYERLLRSMPQIFTIEKTIAVSAQEMLSGGGARPSRVIDLGCGTGLTTLALCEQIRNAVIVGVDKEPAMLSQYRDAVRAQKEICEERGIDVEVRQADALEFLKEQRTASCDIVVSGFVLHNIPKDLRPPIIAEIGRVLRPSGRFVNGDKIIRDDEKLHNRDFLKQIAAYVECYDNEVDAAYGLGWIEHYVRDNQADLKQTETEVHETLSLAGFGNIKIFERHGMDAVISADRLPG